MTRLDDFVSEHGRRPSPRPVPARRARRPRRATVGRLVQAAVSTVSTVLVLARALARRSLAAA